MRGKVQRSKKKERERERLSVATTMDANFQVGSDRLKRRTKRREVLEERKRVRVILERELISVNCSIHHTDRSIELHYDGRSSREAGMINIMSAYELLNNRTSARLSRGESGGQRERGERHREMGLRVRVVVVINTHARNRIYAMEGLMKDWVAQASARGCKSSSGVPVLSANGFSVT